LENFFQNFKSKVFQNGKEIFVDWAVENFFEIIAFLLSTGRTNLLFL